MYDLLKQYINNHLLPSLPNDTLQKKGTNWHANVSGFIYFLLLSRSNIKGAVIPFLSLFFFLFVYTYNCIIIIIFALIQ